MAAVLTEREFRRRFRGGLIVAWVIPPATGELGMAFLGFWDVQGAGLSLVRFTGLYVIGFTLVAYVLFKRQVIEPAIALKDSQGAVNLAHARKLRAFPWVFWGLLGLYCCLGPSTVLLSTAVFENKEYTFGQYALSMFGVIPFLVVAAFPMFFYLTDLLGRFLAPQGLGIMVAPVWLKVTVLGLFTPITIDTILLLYYYNRTGFLAAETVALWFVLILAAGSGTLLAFRSFRQGLASLKGPLGRADGIASDAYPVPLSLDEFGLLAGGWADLLAARDRAETAVRVGASRLAEAQHLSHMGSCEFDLVNNRMKWSPEIYRIFEIDPEESDASYEAFLATVHPDDRERLERRHAVSVEQRAPYEIVYRLLLRNGTVKHVHETCRMYCDEEGNSLRSLGTVQDITARVQVEDELKRSRELLRNLAERLREVREEERTAIAREIHDELGQALTSLRIDLAWQLDHFAEDRPQLAERVRSMVSVIDATIDNVRELSARLRPPILDDLGIAAAIEWYAGRFASQTGIECELDLEADVAVLGNDCTTAVFRILQEALTNIARHAEADRVEIRLSASDGQLVLEVRDDGRGILDSELMDNRSLGLLGMRERGIALGGQFDIRQAPVGGTEVTLRLPLAAAGGSEEGA